MIDSKKVNKTLAVRSLFYSVSAQYTQELLTYLFAELLPQFKF